MTVKSLPLGNGKSAHFGRIRPTFTAPHLKLRNYTTGLAAPPATADYSAKAATVLSQMYMNDTLGDCVIAWIMHNVGVFESNADATPVLATNDDVVRLYGAIGGYVPGNPSTDQGCDEQTALEYWQSKGAFPVSSPTHTIAGYLAVDPTNQQECMTALWLFENLMFGIELPDFWVNPMPPASGFVWDVAGPPDPQNGHCPGGVGYNAQGVTISTWGMLGTLTWAALQKYCVKSAGGELWVVVSQDAINASSQLSPTGLAWSDLMADFQSLGGVVTPPVNPPGPTPVPVPPSPVPIPPAPSPTPQPPSSKRIKRIEKEFKMAVERFGTGIIPYLEVSTEHMVLDSAQDAELEAYLVFLEGKYGY